MRLSGKTAIITGGANGIGAGCVRRLAGEGARVVIADIDADAGGALAAELGESVLYVRADVAERASAEALFDAGVAAFGAVDILVNNAAFVHKPGVISNFLEYSDEAWRRTLDVNLTGMFFCSQIAARLMAKRGAGRRHHQCEQRRRLARPPAHVRLRHEQGRHRGGDPFNGARFGGLEYPRQCRCARQHARRSRNVRWRFADPAR